MTSPVRCGSAPARTRRRTAMPATAGLANSGSGVASVCCVSARAAGGAVTTGGSIGTGTGSGAATALGSAVSGASASCRRSGLNQSAAAIMQPRTSEAMSGSVDFLRRTVRLTGLAAGEENFGADRTRGTSVESVGRPGSAAPAASLVTLVACGAGGRYGMPAASTASFPCLRPVCCASGRLVLRHGPETAPARMLSCRPQFSARPLGGFPMSSFPDKSNSSYVRPIRPERYSKWNAHRIL